jgi:ABC-2 type transport system ATP-binding protein
MIDVEQVSKEQVESSPDYVIEVEGMRKSYGRTQAVRNLTMRVPRGSVYGFVGPNGAGKTTTIRTLATLQRPDAGSVRVSGLDVLRQPGPVRDRVGYMPDFFGVYDSLTVTEYLNFYGASHNIPAARRRRLVGELLDLVDLADKRDQPVEVLSRGMKQRLGLARCLIHDPEVLLLDEPASGMDPRARIELREILRELSAMNKTVLISSHILPELAEMCTHVGIIRSGEMIAEGQVEAVIAQLVTGARLRVRLLDAAQLEAGRAILASDPCCGEIEVEGDRLLSVDYSGEEAERAELLAQMVAQRIAVSSFTLEGGTLEDIFLQVTGDDAGNDA